MVDHRPSIGGALVLDQAESTRTGFWWENARPLGSVRAELLDAIDWLSTTKVQLFERGPDGAPRPVRPGVKPSEVLFILGREGTRRYRQWEEWLVYLELQLSRKGLSAQHVEDLRQSIQEVASEISSLESRRSVRSAQLVETRECQVREIESRQSEAQSRILAEFSELERGLRSAAEETRRIGRVLIPSGVFGMGGLDPVEVEAPLPTEATVDIRRGIDRARELERQSVQTSAAFEAQLSLADRSLAEDQDRLQMETGTRMASLTARKSALEQELETAVRNDKRRYYPAAWARARAFLDREALEAAAVASEEMRKQPRHASELADQMERRLAAQ